jgi:hypothetical protein
MTAVERNGELRGLVGWCLGTGREVRADGEIGTVLVKLAGFGGVGREVRADGDLRGEE